MHSVYSPARAGQTGVTLIELMIALVIIGIIVTLALPNYTDRVRRAGRTDATNTLMAIAAEQEKFFLKNNTYAGALADLGVTKTAEEKYTLSLTLPPTGGYIATAEPAAGESQIHDSECQSFSIDHTGRKTAADADAADSSAKCW